VDFSIPVCIRQQIDIVLAQKTTISVLAPYSGLEVLVVCVTDPATPAHKVHLLCVVFVLVCEKLASLFLVVVQYVLVLVALFVNSSRTTSMSRGILVL